MALVPDLPPPSLQPPSRAAPSLRSRPREPYALRLVLAVGGLPAAFALARGPWRRLARQPRILRRWGKRGTLLRPETSISTPTVGDLYSRKEEPRLFQGLEELSDHYDAFTIGIDQYSALRNGKSAYEGTVDCLKHLREKGKHSVILSNYAGRARSQLEFLPKMGFDPDLVDGIVTSGELVHRYLSRSGAKLGHRVLWVAWPDLESRGLGDFWDGLEGYELASDVTKADFLLLSGVGCYYAGTRHMTPVNFERDGDPRRFEPTFRLAITRGLPMVCANPDRKVIRPDGWKAYLPGALAEHYKRLGGRVIYFGKPYTASFEEAQRLLAAAGAGERVCHVGDSLRHDVAGASKVGLDAAFVVRTGVQGDQLRKDVSVASVKELCKKSCMEPPHAILPRFKW